MRGGSGICCVLLVEIVLQNMRATASCARVEAGLDN